MCQSLLPAAGGMMVAPLPLSQAVLSPILGQCQVLPALTQPGWCSSAAADAGGLWHTLPAPSPAHLAIGAAAQQTKLSPSCGGL